MQHSPAQSRLRFLVVVASLIGLAAGGLAWVLLTLITGITNLALFQRWEWSAHEVDLDGFQPGPWLPLVAVAGSVVVALLARWAPGIRGHGIPEAMEAVLTRQSRVSPRTAIAKPLSIAVALGTGAPFGPEGPVIVTGGSIGSILGQMLRVTPSERKILLGCGAAGGAAAIFGAPIAAVVLAFELLLFEFSARAVVPLIVASSVAGGVHVAMFGSRPLFRVQYDEFSGLTELWMFALLGVGSGLLAVIFCRGLFFTERLYRKLPGATWHPLLGGLGFGVIGLAVPEILGTGYPIIQDTLSARLAVGTLGLLLVGKVVACWLALGSGTSGSLLAPLLFIGGTFGALCGELLADAFPGLGVSVGTMAFVAMAATFGASLGTSFTAIVFAFELTRDYDAIIPLMLATVLADLVAKALLEQNLLTEKLARKGVSVPRRYEPDVLRHTLVRTAMTSPVETLRSDVTVTDARSRLAQGVHRAYPLVDANRKCVGIVTRGDLLGENVSDDEAVSKVASRDVVTVAPDQTMLHALSRLVDEGVNQVPVVDKGVVVGICTRTDVLRVRGRILAQDKARRVWPLPWRGGIRFSRTESGSGTSGEATATNPAEPGEESASGDQAGAAEPAPGSAPGDGSGEGTVENPTGNRSGR